MNNHHILSNTARRQATNELYPKVTISNDGRSKHHFHFHSNHISFFHSFHSPFNEKSANTKQRSPNLMD